MSDGIRKMRQDEIEDEERWSDERNERNEERLCDEEEEKIRSDRYGHEGVWFDKVCDEINSDENDETIHGWWNYVWCRWVWYWW